ncbi:MAG TPA: hypothetical protein VK171_13565 [Fimbriimonas sp.]|nr:hypothetical protein [Fimbriimonas sp.]
MRVSRCIAWIAVAATLFACGGASVGVGATDQQLVVNGTRLALITYASKGDFLFGAKPATFGKTRGPDDIVFDNERKLYYKMDYLYEDIEGDDGITPHIKITLTYHYFTDSAATIPAGTRVQITDTNEYTRIERRTRTETQTAGPLAGFQSSLTETTDMGSSDTNFTMTATHPTYGAMSSTGMYGAGTQSFQFTATLAGQVTTITNSGETEEIRAVLPNGMVISIDDGVGTVKDSSGNFLGDVTVTNSNFTIIFNDLTEVQEPIWPVTQS